MKPYSVYFAVVNSLRMQGFKCVLIHEKAATDWNGLCFYSFPTGTKISGSSQNCERIYYGQQFFTVFSSVIPSDQTSKTKTNIQHQGTSLMTLHFKLWYSFFRSQRYSTHMMEIGFSISLFFSVLKIFYQSVICGLSCRREIMFILQTVYYLFWSYYAVSLCELFLLSLSAWSNWHRVPHILSQVKPILNI